MNNDASNKPNTAWQQRWLLPGIYWTQLARRAPDRGLVSSNRTHTFQLFAWEIDSGQLRQLTDQAHGQRSGTLSPDGRWVYYLQDQQGNEKGHYVRLPFDGGDVQDMTPDLPPYATYGLALSPSGQQLGFTLVDEAGSHIYIIPLTADGQPGARRKIYHSAQMAFDPTFSADDALVVIAATEPTGQPQYALLAFDLATGKQLAELWDGAGTNLKALAFSPQPGDQRLLGATNRLGVERPFIWDVATNSRTDLDLPTLGGDVVPVDWSPDASQILLCQIDQAVQQLYRYDLNVGHLTKLEHPSGYFEIAKNRGTYFYSATEIFTGWEDAGHPPQLIALDARTGVKTRAVLVAAQSLPGRALQSVAFPSSDGQMIQGWLGLPEGEGPFPTIVYLHGGPEFVVMNWFDPESQMWLDNGFAFLTINYRGSTTFGRDFQSMIWGNFGYWELEDMAAAHTWLVHSGIARPDQILVTGWSYGGYLTLLALGKQPDRWAGGMAGAAIADWTLTYADLADTLRSYLELTLGGTPNEKPEQYRLSSPLTYAQQVKAPVLIIQGRHDTRTPPRQVEVYAATMRELGKQIEVEWFDAGHVGGEMDKAIHHQTLMLQFAWRLVGKQMAS